MNTPWDDSKRKFKQVARYMASDFSHRKSVVMLPGNTDSELLVAEEQGMINKKHTRLFLAENKQYYAREIKEVLKFSGWAKNAVLHEGHLHAMKLPQAIDYAHIDLNGTITSKIGYWMATELSNNLLPGAIVCVTQEFCWRSNNWMKVFRKEIIHGPCCEVYNDFRQRNLLIGTDRLSYYITFPPFLIASLLRNWRLAVLEPFRYCDTIDMVLFRFRVLERQPACVFSTPFKELDNEDKDNCSHRSRSNRSPCEFSGSFSRSQG